MSQNCYDDHHTNRHSYPFAHLTSCYNTPHRVLWTRQLIPGESKSNVLRWPISSVVSSDIIFYQPLGVHHGHNHHHHHVKVKDVRLPVQLQRAMAAEAEAAREARAKVMIMITMMMMIMMMMITMVIILILIIITIPTITFYVEISRVDLDPNPNHLITTPILHGSTEQWASRIKTNNSDDNDNTTIRKHCQRHNGPEG